MPQNVDTASHPESAAGAPEDLDVAKSKKASVTTTSSFQEADLNVLHLLGSGGPAQPAERVYLREPYQEPVVPVLVSGVPLGLPVLALYEALSLIRLSTEAHVRLEDYAAGVALVLSALARNGTVIVPALPQAHDQ